MDYIFEAVQSPEQTAIIFQAIIAIAALIGLYQFVLAKGLQRSKLAVEEIKNFIDSTIPAVDDLNRFKDSKNFGTKNIRLITGTLKGYSKYSLEDRKELVRNASLYDKYRTEYDRLFGLAANQLEVLAIGVNKKHVDEDTVATSSANVLCDFVEQNAFIYLLRRPGENSFYSETVELYFSWRDLEQVKSKDKHAEQFEKIIEQELDE